MDLFSKDQVEFILKDRDSESALIKRRVYLSGFFICLFIALLLSRIFFLTVVQNDHYTTKAKENRQKILPIAPIRGLIYSYDGVILAENKPTYSLEVIPEKISDIDQLINHEAFIHVATTINGRKQNKMKILGSNYGAVTKTQEGLAVFSEFITGSIDIDRMRRISDRVKAIHMAIDGANFI